jgi:hypothetical protein
MTDTGTPQARLVDSMGLSSQICPRCASRLVRVARHPLDRLLSFFVPVHRYRCPGFSCRWEGCLRLASPAEPTVPGALAQVDDRKRRTNPDAPT